MDTLSRKHRLRQQQLKQQQILQQQQHQQQPRRNQQQQVVYGCRNGQAQVVREDDHRRYSSSTSSSASTSRHNNGYFNNNNEDQYNDDDDEEEFRVYQVSHASNNQRRQLNCDPGRRLNSPSAMNNQRAYDFQIQYRDATAYLPCDRSIVCNGDAPSMNRHQPAQHHDYSTGDSSGFQSSGFCEPESRLPKQNGHRQSQHQNASQNPNHDQRSRVLDELDRLQMFRRSTQASPTESNYTNSTLNRTLPRNDTTLIRGRERDFSVQCREEFSNFIPANDTNETSPCQRMGPTLIGVHQDESRVRPALESPESDNELVTDDYAFRQDGVSTEASPTGASEYYSMKVDWDLTSLEKYDNLSDQLDIFLNKLDAMLKLAAGEYVGIDESGFANDKSQMISDEELTRIEIVPLEGIERRVEILNEYQIAETTTTTACDEATKTTNEKLAISQTVISGQKGQIDLIDAPAHPCDCVQLHWERVEVPTIEEIITEEANQISEGYVAIEESLLDSLMGADPPSSGEVRGQRRVDLVNTVKGHLSEFLEDYLEYRAEFKRQTTYATGWRDNWLFASNWSSPGDHDEWQRISSRRKRTKLDTNQTCDSSGMEPSELTRYSTLTLMKYKPIKLVCFSGETSDQTMQKLYDAQENFLSELQARSLDSVGQVDVCRQLLKMSAESEDGEEASLSADQLAKIDEQNASRFKVSYSSSLAIGNKWPNTPGFAAYGYLFNLPNHHRVKVSESKVDHLKSRILKRFIELVVGKPDKPIQHSPADRVRFLVNLADVSLVNKLPVIQFCAKFSGALPISVRWFREAEGESVDEMSDISDSKRRQNLRLHQRPSSQSQSISIWPIEMEANYDYEYQTSWSSWCRFRRAKGEIMFELRNADETKDHNTAYKCVIQNYCSRQECEFRLTRRKPPRLSATRRKCQAEAGKQPVARNKVVGRDKHALLRSWSQRTLHRPAPTVVNGDNDTASCRVSELPRIESSKNGQQQQVSSIGKHLTCSGGDSTQAHGKFGQDFPYHPANLLKRLKENKYLVVQQKTSKSSVATPDSQSFSGQQQQHREDTTRLVGRNYNDMPISESMDSFEPIEVEALLVERHKNLDENENEQHCGGFINDQKNLKAKRQETEVECEDRSLAGGQRPKFNQAQKPVVPKPRLRINKQQDSENGGVGQYNEDNSTREVPESRFDGQGVNRKPAMSSEIKAISADQATGAKSPLGETNGGDKRFDRSDSDGLQGKNSPISNNNNNNEACIGKPNVKSLISRFSLA